MEQREAISLISGDLGWSDPSLPKKERLFKRHLVEEFVRSPGEEQTEQLERVLLMLISGAMEDNRGIYRFWVGKNGTFITRAELEEMNYKKVVAKVRKTVLEKYDYQTEEVRGIRNVHRYSSD